jgi:hypothetical protein
MGRILCGVALIVWGVYAVASTILQAWNKELADPGVLGEITGGSICSFILLGAGIPLVLPSRHKTLDPANDPDSGATGRGSSTIKLNSSKHRKGELE